MKRLPRQDQGNGQLKCACLSIAGFHWFSNFPDRREHLILACQIEWTLGVWYKHHIAHTTSLCIIGTQDTPIYLRGRQISAAPSIAIIAPFGGVFHALTTNVWQMGRINIMKQRRNAVRVGKYSDSEDCTIPMNWWYWVWTTLLSNYQYYKRLSTTLPVRVDYWFESVNNDKTKPYYFAQTSYTLCLTILCTLIYVDWWSTSQTTYFRPDDRYQCIRTMLYMVL